MTDAGFAVTCDRPCESAGASLVPGISNVSLGTADDPNIVAVKINTPNPMPPRVTLGWELRSMDEKPIKVLKVERITRLP